METFIHMFVLKTRVVYLQLNCPTTGGAILERHAVLPCHAEAARNQLVSAIISPHIRALHEKSQQGKHQEHNMSDRNK